MDGQTEVLNRVVEQYLRSFVHGKPTSWGKFLLWAEYYYNTLCHSGSGVSLYEVTYGKKPLTIPQYITGTSRVEAIDDFLSNRESVFTELRKKLLKVQEHMKLSADMKRRNVNFECGDLVMVKLRPHRQTSTSGSNVPYSKLAKRFYDPYRVLEDWNALVRSPTGWNCL